MWSLLYVTYIINWMYIKNGFLFILVIGRCSLLYTKFKLVVNVCEVVYNSWYDIKNFSHASKNFYPNRWNNINREENCSSSNQNCPRPPELPKMPPTWLKSRRCYIQCDLSHVKIQPTWFKSRLILLQRSFLHCSFFHPPLHFKASHKKEGRIIDTKTEGSQQIN